MTFEEKLNALNVNQRLAVETIEGPVMVIAGPGTGKTEILSLRIGYILKHTDTPPGSILCLTYTDAASSEMRHRLIDYIGPEAYSIQVSTFHSFCNLVIQENPAIFQQARELEPISDIDKFKLLQKLIDGFGDQHLLKRFKGFTYSDWDRLHGLFMIMKKENWSPQYMYDHIHEYIARMEAGEDFRYKNSRKGQWEKGELRPIFKTEVLDKMAVLKAAVSEYDHYNALMAAEGKYDYEDMLLWVNDALGKYPDLLANYQERFLYFLVDEFQDTNGIQIAILQKLIEHEWLDKPNVFVVGDDDQAIYRFQGANIENLVQFHTRYEPEVILLEQNYRSSQRILDAARVIMKPVENNLIQQIFGQSKKLAASGAHADHEQHVIIQSYPNLAYENADIFFQIRKWHEEMQEGSFAVLYSKHELGADLAQALKGAGIPFHTLKTIDALHHQTVRHLLDIIWCIHQLSDGADNDDALLYRVLHLRYLEPRTADLQRMILAYTSKERNDRSTLYMWMSDIEKLDSLVLKDRRWMEKMAELLNESIIAYHSLTLVSFVEWIAHQFGILQWILHQPEKFTHLYALKTFYTFVEKEASGKTSFRVPDLLEICELMKQYGIRLPVHELAAPTKGIYLSSLHGAKGLEYEKVVIKNVTENEWEKKRAYNRMFSFPDNLVRKDSFSESFETGVDIEDQDKRRLLYVGMTRAKQELMLTYALNRDDGKGLVPSLYLTEIEKEEPGVLHPKATVHEDMLAEYLVARMSGEQRADIKVDEAEILDRIKNMVLNATSLNQYLECPVKFYYEKILMVPATESAPLLFGSALHDALQQYFRRRFVTKDETVGKDFLIWMFEVYIDRNKHRFTPKEFTDHVTYGKNVLGQYYDQYAASWDPQILYEPEYKIRDVHIEGVPVKGFIDRLDKIGDTLLVYDYKSGNPKNIPEKLKRPKDENDLGGNYWRQMVFYDLLLRQDTRIRGHMAHGYIHGLEPDKDGKFLAREVSITEEDRAFVTKQIVDTYQHIQQMEFDKGCGECEWCKMHDLNPPLLNGEDDFGPQDDG